MRARLVVAVSAALLLAQLARLAYLAPGSLGAREDNFDGFAIALLVLTMANFGAALLICVTAVPRNLRGIRNLRAVSELQADLLFRLSELVSRRSRPMFGVIDAGLGSWLVMLGDGSDSSWFGDGVGVGLGPELGWRVEQLVA